MRTGRGGLVGNDGQALWIPAKLAVEVMCVMTTVRAACFSHFPWTIPRIRPRGVRVRQDRLAPRGLVHDGTVRRYMKASDEQHERQEEAHGAHRERRLPEEIPIRNSLCSAM